MFLKASGSVQNLDKIKDYYCYEYSKLFYTYFIKLSNY